MTTLFRPKNILFSMIALAIVLVPAYSNAATDTITGLLGKTDSLSTLKTLVELAKLDGALDSTESQFTVFAPQDSGFAALPKEVTDALVKPENVEVLAGILKYHVIPSKILSTDLEATQTVTTLNGDTIVVAKNESGVTITDKTGSVSTVVTADVEATNGVVHIVDKVLLDKAYDFSPKSTAKLQDTGLNLAVPSLLALLLVVSSVLVYSKQSSKK
jgi:uncharacterized surface protein with fasciclin (FAS1) repeats